MNKEVYIINKKIIKKINKNETYLNMLMDVYYDDTYHEEKYLERDKQTFYNFIKKIDFNLLKFNKTGNISKHINMYIFIFYYDDNLITKFLLSKLGINPDCIYSAYYRYVNDFKDYGEQDMGPDTFRILSKYMNMEPFFKEDYIIGQTLTDFIKSNNLKIKKKSLKYYIGYKNILDELLEISIQNNDIKYAQLLINYGANINYICNYCGAIDIVEYNLLSVALDNNNIKIIRFLISNGISLNPKFSLYKLFNIPKNHIIKYIIKYNIFSYAKINAHIKLKYNKIIKQNNILNKKYNIIIYIN
jgi:hypothetical protein